MNDILTLSLTSSEFSHVQVETSRGHNLLLMMQATIVSFVFRIDRAAEASCRYFVGSKQFTLAGQSLLQARCITYRAYPGSSPRMLIDRVTGERGKWQLWFLLLCIYKDVDCCQNGPLMDLFVPVPRECSMMCPQPTPCDATANRHMGGANGWQLPAGVQWQSLLLKYLSSMQTFCSPGGPGTRMGPSTEDVECSLTSLSLLCRPPLNSIGPLFGKSHVNHSSELVSLSYILMTARSASTARRSVASANRLLWARGIERRAL